MQIRVACFLVLLGVTPTVWAKQESTTKAVQPHQLSLLRVNVTGQGYDYFRPWQKRAPFSKRALGAVLSQGRILVTADLVANENYVELERAESGDKMAASVEVVDYEANLALLQPQDKKFLDGLAPLELANDTVVGDRVAALHLEQTGALVVTDGLVTAAQAMRYPVDVGNFDVDQNVNYVDPIYKKLDLTNLLTTRAYVGDKVPLKIHRQGKPMQLDVTMEHRAPDEYIISPYSRDEAPKYYILGGLIFQELSRQYLREWGPNWLKEAPQRFVYLDHFQWELFPEGHRHVVVLSQVLPVNGTIGYEDFGYLTVTKVNGKDVHSLDDLAEAVKQPIDGFDRIETEEDPKIIPLDVAQAENDEPTLRESYGIPTLQRLR